MRSLLAISGLSLAAIGGTLYLNYGGWAFILSCFVGFGCVVLALIPKAG